MDFANSNTAAGQEELHSAVKSPVKFAIHTTEKTIDEIFDLIIHLEKQLEPTLAPQKDTGEQKALRKSLTGSSPLYSQMTRCNDRLIQMRGRVEEISRRIEV